MNLEDEKEIKKYKAEIRRNVLKRRDGMDRKERERGDLLLTERILGHQWFYRSTYFICFVSYGSEIGTAELLQEALRAGKKVYVPKVSLPQAYAPQKGDCLEGKADMGMNFFRIYGPEELKPGYKGIPEPEGRGEEYRYSEEAAERTLMLMPGVAFDQYRNRIGYGKGFYDRYLADKPLLQLRTIGVGYKCQLADKIPAEERDIRPYQVICV